ncbi:TOPRIM nucleotidyl transferase/hydrolase domain-containing protein [Candidatus Nitrosotenuis cloacae]|uniref:TOPRIM nucleotidyl transferase/hydrolase domain-containing protein n=1 Tax=Candidatus Nitrosotenuis cloacae TaxID=1603555 RepID=UPI002281AF6B|nr:TOPRIM nucleotidyl transferase/hydrolase domain-containing protein [Candidatus Nitrosotenuis cloacae]
MELMDPDRFIRFLEEYGIRIRKERLESLEEEGLLQPIVRFVVPKQVRRKGGGMMTGTDVMQWYYKHTKFIEFPKKGDYQPWKKFASNYKKGDHYEKKIFYYHPFQLLQVENILKYQKFYFYYKESYTDKHLQRILQNIKLDKKHRKKTFHISPLSQPDKIGFLMLLEEAYRFQAFGGMSIPMNMDGKRNSFEKWIKWRKTKFSAQKLLEQSRLTIDEVKWLYDWFARSSIMMDPLERWYDLTRIMKTSVLQKLKGDALKAQLYYDIVRMIAMFLFDLGHKVEEPDLQFDEMKGKWKNEIYGVPEFNYSSKQTQRGIIRYFTRKTNTVAFVLVEGNTEVKIIEKIFEKLDIDPVDDGYNIINYDGLANLTPIKLRSIIQMSNADNIPIFIIADNECNAKDKIQKIKNSVVSKFDYEIWNKSFEEDNFGIDKVLKLINKYLEKHKERISKNDIKTKIKTNSLIRAVELAYREKYYGDIFVKIPSKPDLALELIRNRLRKISRGKKIGKELPIEQSLHRMFRFVATYEPA